MIDFDPGPQSGGRAPAPGRLGLVQAFVNSHFDLDPERWGNDQLAGPDDLAAWLASRGLLDAGGTATAVEHARALAVREGLRAQLLGREEDLRAAAAGLRTGLAVDADGRTQLVPASGDVAGALGFLLGLRHEAQAAGTWPRLKACPGDHCGWAFYDRSRNGTSTWCSMRVCGGRKKARAYRRRSS